MEIKVGNRYRCIGRNMDRFECVVARLENSYISRVVLTNEWAYTASFFKANFEPVEGIGIKPEKSDSETVEVLYSGIVETKTEFKVGDKVKVEYESSIIGKNEHGFYLDFPYANLFIQAKHLTLIEPAKPKLEVGQKWECEEDVRREIVCIRNGKMSYWSQGEEEFYDCDIEYFMEHYAHKLLETANG